MKRFILTAAAATLLVLASVSGVAAKQSRVLATPSAVCSELVAWHVGGYTSFGNCMGHINKDVAAYRFPDDATGDPTSLSTRCSQFENGVFDPNAGGFVMLSYPFTFEEGPDWPFTTFSAHNHVQCERTLFAYHTLASLFGG